MSLPAIAPNTATSSLLRPKKCIRDSKYWFADGDVILVAESSEPQAVHLFRVHKPLLDNASLVFRKSLSENPNQTSYYDGARSIVVPRANCKILMYFLHFLYNPYNVVPMRIVIDTSFCEEFLQLCEELRARAISTPMRMRLFKTWSLSLSSWDQTDDETFAAAQEYPRMGENFRGQTTMMFHDDMYPEPVSTIRLGRTCDLPDILPAALYHLSRIDPASDHYKMHTEPDRSSLDSQQRLNSGLRSARWADLTTQDHYALTEFRDYIQTCLTRLMAETSTHLACKAGVERTYLDIVRCSMATRDILRVLKSSFNAPHGICGSCIMQGKTITSSMRTDIWNQLSVVLRL